MTVQAQQVLKDVLDLTPIERAELVEQILTSFEFSNRKEIDEAWAREAEDRIEAFERGELKTVSAEEVFDRINKQPLS